MGTSDAVPQTVREEQKPKKKDSSAPQRPDATAYQEKVGAATKAIDDTKTKLKELRDRINDASSGRDDFNKKKTDLRKEMDGCQGRVDTLETERKDIISSIESHRQSGQKVKNELNAMKKNIGFTTEEEINEKIKEIETSMMVSTIPLREEKKLLQQIQQLKANKRLVGKYSTIEANANDSGAVLALKARLDQIGEELKVLRQKKKSENERFRSLVNERQAEAGPLRELYEKRDRNRRIHDEQVAQRRAHHEAFNAAMRQWQEYQNQLRTVRNEKIKEDKMRQATERQRLVLERQLEKMDALPFESEVLLLEQTIAYVRKLIDGRATKTGGTGTANEATQWATEAFEGEGETLLPKAQRSEKFQFIPKKTGAQRKGTQNLLKKTGKTAAFKHDIGTLSYFEQCGVPAPVSEDDLQECLTQLEKRLAEHKGQQQGELEKHEEKRKDLEAQLIALDSADKPIRPPIAAERPIVKTPLAANIGTAVES